MEADTSKTQVDDDTRLILVSQTVYCLSQPHQIKDESVYGGRGENPRLDPTARGSSSKGLSTP